MRLKKEKMQQAQKKIDKSEANTFRIPTFTAPCLRQLQAYTEWFHFVIKFANKDSINTNEHRKKKNEYIKLLFLRQQRQSL